MSVAYALRGEYDKAGELIRQVYLYTLYCFIQKILNFFFQLWTAKNRGIEVPIQIITLALYIELQLGKGF